MPKKHFSLSRRHLAVLCASLLCLSLLPLYGISFFNHPFYDDFGFSIRTHAAWRETGSVAQVVTAAFENTVGIRQTWEGTYTTSLLGALQPALLGESLYFITTWLLLTFLLLALWLFLRQTLFHGFKTDLPTFITAFCCLAFLMVHFVPDPAEAFFWYNGGTAYTLMWCLMLVCAALWTRLGRAATGKKAALQMVLLVPLMVLLGGAKYSTVLFACLCALCATAWAFHAKNPRRLCYLALTALLLACFAFNMAAPGNEIRAKTLQGGMGAPMALVQSFYFGLALMGSWFSLPLAAALILVGCLLRPALLQSKCRFAYPLLITLASICLFCAQLTPTLFTGNYLGDGRTLNTYYDTYVLMVFGNVLYWLGWGLRRLAAKAPVEIPSPAAPAKGIPLRVLSLVLVLLVVGALSFRPEGAESWGPQNMAGGSAAISLIRGEPQEFDRQMTARDAELNDPAKPEVILTPVTVIPRVFMSDALSSSSLTYVLSLYAEYYDKTAVTASPAKE